MTFISAIGQSGGNFGLGPTEGTLQISGNVQLLAGHLYRLDYLFGTFNFAAPPSTAAWIGNGALTFSIQPLPESATLAPMAFAALVQRRHRNRR